MSSEDIHPNDKEVLEALAEGSGSELQHLEQFNYNYSGYTIKEGRVNKLSLTYSYSLTELPEIIGNLEGLEELSLSSLQITDLPETIANLRNLKILKFSYLGRLTQIPKTIENLPNLETLEIQNCYGVRELSIDFSKLNTLKHLKLLYTPNTPTLPEEIVELENLEELELNLPIHSLPEGLGSLQSLKKLIIRNAYQLEALPESIGDLKNLEFFEINSADHIETLPDSISKLENLKELKFNYCYVLKSLPDNIGNLTQLIQLIFINCNALTALPKDIGLLKNLELLSLNNCDVKTIPDSISNCKALKKLELIYLKSLERLPEELHKIPTLEELIIDNCSKLSRLPGSYKDLTNLKTVKITNCGGLVLTPSIFLEMPKIEHVSIKSCVVNEHPDIAAYDKKIKEINLADNVYSPSFEEKLTFMERLWKREFEPWRKLLLWGKYENDPSYIILYGKHEFEGIKIHVTEEDIERYASTSVNPKQLTTGTYDVLRKNVKYVGFYIIRGKKGHLPSFEATKIIQKSRYDYNTRQYIYEEPALYYTKDVEYRWGWRADETKKISTYFTFTPSENVVLPYFEDLTAQEIINLITEKGIDMQGFQLVRNPNEILKLEGELATYLKLVEDMMAYQNIYIRKKRLSEIVDRTPPLELLQKILTVGSSEVIAGLFLELAKRNSPILKEHAQKLLQSDIDWTQERFARGVQRCVKLYLNSLNPEIREERIKKIREELSGLEIRLRKVWNREIPKDREFTGSQLRKYAMQGVYKLRRSYYDYESRKYITKEREDLFYPTSYCDGTKFDHLKFKNTVQEAERYGLGDVIGKIAYYIDSPSLYFYLKGTGNYSAVRYYQRYLKRIIKEFAEKDDIVFIEAMKALLSSYKEEDYLGKFPDNFIFNKMLIHYLYYDFKERPPRGWRYWQERYLWYTTDQLVGLEGRYEYQKSIWDNHLDAVIEIALHSPVAPILRSCYYILKDSPNKEALLMDLSNEQVITLSLSNYAPLSEMFNDILDKRINEAESFDLDLMLTLMKSDIENHHQKALEYFEKTRGSFSPEALVDLLFLPNILEWIELFDVNVGRLEGDAYHQFITQLILKSQKMKKHQLELDDALTGILSQYTSKINSIEKKSKIELIDLIIDFLFHEKELLEWFAAFIEELLFSLSFEDLHSVAASIKLDSLARAPTSRNNRVIAILRSFKYETIPTDAEIIDILESGTPKTINTFITLATHYQEKLKKRISTLLIMLETKVIPLNLLVGEVFDVLSEEQKQKALQILIDSPVDHAYRWGIQRLEELYGDRIPGEMIVQLFEHPSPQIKAYISNTIDTVIDQLGNGDRDLFIYYLKTLAYLPYLNSLSKDKLYHAVPAFALKYRDKIPQIKSILKDIGGSNIIIDSERALKALAQIKLEVEY
ncbi:MAG: hypothetical protein BAJALOKI1v1_70021 [Promethearchaeota archaeon]|nr:MAG: hypothetical protein BAJALOKI1v1_70021 [Candidatus Lokiarchaeota archaeon]